jgi:uncharacterized BrkB/YihY/UPF0761 family membrane protein
MNQQGESIRTGGEYRNTNEAWDRTQPERESEHVSSGSVPHLLRQLTGEVTTLFVKEVSLARAEVRETVGGIKAGMVSLLSGGIVLHAGFIILLLAAVYGLANYIELWLSALIVGAVVSVIGFSMVSAGKKKLDADTLKPERTVNSLKEDRDAMKSAVKGGAQ